MDSISDALANADVWRQLVDWLERGFSKSADSALEATFTAQLFGATAPDLSAIVQGLHCLFEADGVEVIECRPAPGGRQPDLFEGHIVAQAGASTGPRLITNANCCGEAFETSSRGYSCVFSDPEGRCVGYLRVRGGAGFAEKQAELALGLVAQRAKDALLARYRRSVEQEREDKLTQAALDLQRFAYYASHDLKAPLRHMETYTGFLAQEIEAGHVDGSKAMLGRLENSVQRLQQMTDALLQFSRLHGKVNSEAVSLRELVEKVVTSMEERLDAAQVSVEFDELPIVNVPYARAVAVIENLVSNVVVHAGPNTCVRVSSEDGDPGWAVISLVDDGCGLDAKDNPEELFEMFVRGHVAARQKTSGLGLAVCRRAVSEWGGHIELRSVPGEGVSVRMTMPLAQCD